MDLLLHFKMEKDDSGKGKGNWLSNFSICDRGKGGRLLLQQGKKGNAKALEEKGEIKYSFFPSGERRASHQLFFFHIRGSVWGEKGKKNRNFFY